jgi:hypothetical protein
MALSCPDRSGYCRSDIRSDEWRPDHMFGLPVAGFMNNQDLGSHSAITSEDTITRTSSQKGGAGGESVCWMHRDPFVSWELSSHALICSKKS